MSFLNHNTKTRFLAVNIFHQNYQHLQLNSPELTRNITVVQIIVYVHDSRKSGKLG